MKSALKNLKRLFKPTAKAKCSLICLQPSKPLLRPISEPLTLTVRQKQSVEISFVKGSKIITLFVFLFFLVIAHNVGKSTQKSTTFLNDLQTLWIADSADDICIRVVWKKNNFSKLHDYRNRNLESQLSAEAQKNVFLKTSQFFIENSKAF